MSDMDIRKFLLEDLNPSGRFLVAHNDTGEKSKESEEKPKGPSPEEIIAKEQEERRLREASELEQKLKAAFDDGFRQGQEQQKMASEATIQATIAASLEQWKNHLSAYDAACSAWKEEMTTHINQLMHAMADTMIKRRMKEDPLEEVNAVLEAIMPKLEGKNNVKITVNTAIAAELETQLKAVNLPIEVVSSDDVAVCDCNVEWGASGVQISKEEIWDQLCSIIGISSNKDHNEKSHDEGSASLTG